MMRFLDLLRAVFSTWRFPTYALGLLTLFSALVLGMLVVPASPTAFGAFAEEFKVWCFGYDPATGHFEWSYVVMVAGEFALLSGVIVGVWWRPLRALRRRPRGLLGPLGAALATVTLVAAAFGATQPPPLPPGELPFPSARIRTAFAPPDFTLTDQTGARVRLADLRGQVVMLTAVYASCGFTCPMLMRDAKRAVASLTPDERRALTVVAITLAPERDTAPVLARMADAHHVAAPLWRLVTGDAALVERALDDLSVPRVRDPRTGVIDHANVFILLDRRGRIAYRLSLGDRSRNWLSQGLRELLHE